MLGHRELTMQDYAEILKRRFWLMLITTILIFCVAVGVSLVIAPQYVSKTTVLIDPQKVPEDYVKSVDSEGLDSRLASIEEQIKSRSQIEPIVERFDLFGGNKYTMDDRVDMTRAAIKIQKMHSDQSHGMPGFSIEFKASDAHIAQQVCGEITSNFIGANLNAREESAEGTTDFLKQQLADAKRNLDDQDAKLASFQRKYVGKLPEQEQANLNTLQALTTRLDAITQGVSRMEQDETMLQGLIAQQAQESSRADPVTGTSQDTLKSQLKEAIAQEKELEALYTPDHPDVTAIKRKIANLRTEMARAEAEPAKKEAASDHFETPQLLQLKTQLRGDKQSLAAAKQEQAQIEQQVRAYEGRVESSPLVEEEYKQVTRDHETALQFYNTLLSKMNESSMATALEHRQQGEQFRVMDAPNLPDAPTFPNRRVFAGAGFACGLVVSLLLAGLLEYRDTSLRSENDVWAFTKLPTLAVISYIDVLAKPEKNFLRGKLFSRSARRVESVRE